MKKVFETFRQYLDDSGDPEMLKANPNLVKEAHDSVFSTVTEDEITHELLATKYFTAYLNDEGKKKFFPPGFFPS